MWFRDGGRLNSDYYDGEAVCVQCEDAYTTWGKDYGDNIVDPREFIPEEELCPRCKDGFVFTLTFNVVCEEDFSKIKCPNDWTEWFEGFDSVFLKGVKVERIR